jgi:DnaJ-class molecular chaperone
LPELWRSFRRFAASSGSPCSSENGGGNKSGVTSRFLFFNPFNGEGGEMKKNQSERKVYLTTRLESSSELGSFMPRGCGAETVMVLPGGMASPVRCGFCSGRTVHLCPRCFDEHAAADDKFNGRETTTCPSCDGSGTDIPTATCDTCDGSGRVAK